MFRAGGRALCALEVAFPLIHGTMEPMPIVPGHPHPRSPEGTIGSRFVGDPVDLVSPEGTRRLLSAFRLRPRKRWGQHFLVSRRALDTILAVAAPDRTDSVLDIGAGLGTLTAALAQRAGWVIAVERDPLLLPALQATVGVYSNVRVVEADIMVGDLAGLFDHLGPRKVVANLPYYLASPLIVSLLEQPLGVSRLVLTVQREVADRVAASPGGRDYGALSVAVQYRATASVVGRLPPGAFYPAPAVDSAILLLQVRGRPAVAVDDEAAFFTVVRAGFAHRRKTLRNALARALIRSTAEVEAACTAAGIDPRRRAETLSLEEFAALAQALPHASKGDARRVRKEKRDD